MTKAAKGIAAAVAIGCVINRVGRRSGATGAEVEAHLPGDEIVRDPMWQSTRAITIDKPPGEVWPWIVQMGFPSHRAGWYTPYWLDKLMWGIHRPSAETIVPGLQRLGVGDIVPDSEDVSVFFTVADIERDRALVLHSTRHLLRPIRAIDFTWAFVLSGRSAGRTRLIMRARVRFEPWWGWPVVELLIGPGDFVNAAQMLRGIKRRAERAA